MDQALNLGMEAPKTVNPAIEKIAVECEEAGATKWDVIRIVKTLAEAGEEDEQVLRQKTLEILQELNPAAAEVYSSFNKMQVRTSAEKIEHFDRGNIIRSLLRETDITRGVAEKIGAEVEDQIKDLKIDYLNASLIRALTDVKLLEYGHEEIHRQYARVGLPVYDMEQKLLEGNFDGKEALREYHWLRIIPREISNKHFRGELFIHAVEDFSTKVYAYTMTPVIEHTNAVDAAVELGARINRYRAWVSLPVSIRGLNYGLAAAAEKLGSTKRKRFVASVLKMLQLTYPETEQQLAPSVGINLYTASLFEAQAGYKKTAIELGTEFIRQYAAMKEPKFRMQVAVDSRYKLKLIKSKNLPGIEFLNCTDHDLIPLNGHAHSRDSPGLRGVVGINLPRIIHNAESAVRKGGNLARSLAESLKVLEGVRDKQLHERAYLAENGISLNQLASGVYVYAPPDQMRIEKEGKAAARAAGFRDALLEHFLPTNYITREALGRFVGGESEAGNAFPEDPAMATARSLKQAGDAIAEGIEHVVMH